MSVVENPNPYFLHIASPERSDAYLFKVNGSERLVEPAAWSLEGNHRVVEGSRLALHNLGLTNDGEADISLNSISSESIPKLSSVTIALVATTEYFSLKEEPEAMDEAVRNTKWPSLLNRGDLVQADVVECDMPSSRKSSLYVEVRALVDSNNDPVQFGRFDSSVCKTAMSSRPCGSRLPGVRFPAGPVDFNTSLGDGLRNIVAEGLLKPQLCPILLVGPLGFGKRTLLAKAVAEAGLSVFSPSGMTKDKFLASALEFAKYQPCCIKIEIGDFETVHRILRSVPLSGTIVLAVLADGLDAKYDGAFRHVIKFRGPSSEEREVFLQQALPSELSGASVGLTNGLSIADLIQLRSTVRLYEKMRRKPVTEDDLETVVKAIRTSKSGRFGQVPKVAWEAVAGLAEAKELIHDLLEFPINRSKELNQMLGRRTGVLFYGPPGSGKTLLAKALATQYQLSFMAVKGPELMSMYIGETESNIRELFAQARLTQPTILFFDELDSLASARGQDGDSGRVTDRIVAQVMVELDRVNEEPECNVFVIGATNRPDLLDPSLLRPGRLDKSIYLGAPTSREEQVAILKASSRGMCLDSSVNFGDLELSCQHSPADLANICRVAMRRAVKRRIAMLEQGVATDDLLVTVTQDDFVEAIPAVKPSLASYAQQ